MTGSFVSSSSCQLLSRRQRSHPTANAATARSGAMLGLLGMDAGGLSQQRPVVRRARAARRQRRSRIRREDFELGWPTASSTSSNARVRRCAPLYNMDGVKTNPYGMEVMREIGDLSQSHTPRQRVAEAPSPQVIARAVQAAEPFLQRIMIVRQLLFVRLFAYGPDFATARRQRPSDQST